MENNIIRALPKSIADKIAAGEVVERPLSIVKELTENAVDAGAKSITVEIKKGGKEYIRVTDDGCGIPADQVALAFQRYATSKIYTDDDLNAIQTLGFRGEALASIASVTRIELITRTADEKTGTKLVIQGGEIIENSPAGCSEGTTIVVTDLFYNTPARRKFLKTDNAESALITDFISKMAIAYPELRIRMISNGTILFSTLGNNDLKQAIMTVYSPELTRKALSVLAVDTDKNMYIKGYTGAPSEAKKSRKYQIFFVNGRLVKSSLIEKALDEAYSDKMFSGEYPSAFLFLQISPGELDVNIHPAKTEIRFYEEDNVKDFIVKSIRRALLAPEVSDVLADKKTAVENLYEKYNTEDSMTSSVFPGNFNFDTPKFAEVPVKEAPARFVSTADPSKAEDTLFSFMRKEKEEEKQQEMQLSVAEDEEVYQVSDRLVFSGLEYIGSVFNTYLMLKDDEAFYLIDQHAAHERVLFEKLMNRFNSRNTESQILLFPSVMHLTPAQKEQTMDLVEDLAVLGYKIEEFGQNEMIVKAVPSCLSLPEAENFLREVIETEGISAEKFRLKKEEIISNSCKAAIKGGDRISEDEVSELLRQLDKCENPYNCPHGRPTFVRYTQYELERLFKRK